MSVWLTIPSARPVGEASKRLEIWVKQGYKIALWRDSQADFHKLKEYFGLECGAGIFGPYPGYAKAVNHLVSVAMLADKEAEWFVIGGDDVEPDMNYTAEEIAMQCSIHFVKHHAGVKDGDELSIATLTAALHALRDGFPDSTFGVMQPTGDRFAEGSIDRICGSAWLGREFCRRINQGNGPLWPEYIHNFVDEELQAVAVKYGIFEQRRDLIHLHRHFQREADRLNSPATPAPTPAHLVHAFSPEGWGPYKAIFDARKAAGFPGSEPIA